MSDFMSGFSPQSPVVVAFGHLRSFVSSIIAIVWLLALYAFTIWIVVGSLSAIQMYDELVLDDLDGGFQDLFKAERQISSEQNKIYNEIYEIDRVLDLKRQGNILMNALAASVEWQSLGDSALSDPLRATSATPTVVVNSALYEKATNACNDTSAKAALSTRFCRDVADLATVQSDLKGSGLNQSSAELYTLRQDREATASEIRNQHPLSAHFGNLSFFNYWRYHQLTYLPRSVLVMVLTMSMGVLGSVITMTWALLGSDRLGIKALMMLPLVGCMSAFVILVFAKAGQITLSTGTDSGSLNPFFISFLGIISGLLSERAYNRMAQIGNRFFEAGDEVPRWGIGLAQIVEDEKIALEDLSDFVDLPQKELRQVLDGTQSALPEKQTLIAAALRRRKELLFTDLRPNGEDAPVTTPETAEPLVATELTPILTAEGQTVKAIATALEEDVATLTPILEGRTAASPALAARIAAFLRRPIAEIFPPAAQTHTTQST